MKIKYLERNWEAIGEREITEEYILPDEVVVKYQHIAQIFPDEKFSFLESIHIAPAENIVENSYEIVKTFFFNIGNSLNNHFNISLFYEKVDLDLKVLSTLLGVEMVEHMEHNSIVSKNCAGIEIDIIGIDYGMVFIHMPFWERKEISVSSVFEIAKKLDHYFFTILEEIRDTGKGVVPLVPSYAYERKKVKIFISHSSKDKEFARLLRNSLHAENIDTWFDEDDILVGDDFIQSMEEGLEQSDFIAIVLSPNFETGPWAQKEYRTALTEQINKGNTKILPVKFKDSNLPAMLRSISHADFSKDYDQGLKILLRSIRLRISRERNKEEI
jgi:hypothetical protein